MTRFSWINLNLAIWLAILCGQALADSFDLNTILGQTYFLSHEEGPDVYRPEGFSFAASHPRAGFRFDADGVYTFFSPTPDGVVTKTGSWERVGNSTYKILQHGALKEKVRLSGNAQRLIKARSCNCGRSTMCE